MKLVSLTFFLLPALFAQQKDWAFYGGDPGGQRYSTLTQINVRNVAKLKPVWQYGVGGGVDFSNAAARAETGSEAVPLMVNGVLFLPTRQKTIVALEPETGKEVWKYDLGTVSAPLRGVAYWQGDPTHPAQILAGTMDGRLLAINAKTGKLVPGFGDEGAVNLRAGVADRYPNSPYHMGSPGTIVHNLIVTGAQGKEDDPGGPDMDVRAWDLRTGKLVWTFHTIPHPGEAGYETWPKDYWTNAGSPA